ncbi:MAG: response regulator transcription factor [Spirochaetes bacterium]|nr:response regulator transcription factor [Spirochaetota bacterium]
MDQEAFKGEIKKKKVLLIDDHPVVRNGIKQIIDLEENYFVSGEASNADEAIAEINKNQPDIAIIDITLGSNASGIDLVKKIKERFPKIISLILSMHDEGIFAERAIRAGAKGYLMKEVAPVNIIAALDKISSGNLYLSKEMFEKIVDKMVHGVEEKTNTSVDVLSDRELEVFQHIGNGYSSKEISKKLNLSIYTVESHKRNIREKLKLHDASELLRYAIQWVFASKKVFF